MPPKKDTYRYRIRTLSILYQVDPKEQKNGNPSYDVFTNGSYTSGGISPVGPLMLNGKLVTLGAEKTYGRGGVAVLQDGSVVVGRLKNPDKSDVANIIQKSFSAVLQHGSVVVGRLKNPDKLDKSDLANIIQKSFSKENNKVVSFIGGGALVVEEGKVVPNSNLFCSQNFDQVVVKTKVGTKVRLFSKEEKEKICSSNPVVEGGYNSTQLEERKEICWRVAIGTNDKNADLIITSVPPVHAPGRFTYKNLVFFDGGRGFWAHERDKNGFHLVKGVNSTGFGVMGTRILL
jgi:hypothetical protein